MFRQTIGLALSQFSFIDIIFEAENGIQLLSLLENQKPDVLLLDIKMPLLDGLKALEVIFKRYPEIRVLILSAFVEEAYVTRALELGVNGYLTKNMDINEIVNAVQLASDNEVFHTNLLTNTYFKNYIVNFKKKFIEKRPNFSLQEIQIVELLKEEKTVEEIAKLMCLSRRCIELKLNKMKDKLNVSTIGGLLLCCYKIGIIS